MKNYLQSIADYFSSKIQHENISESVVKTYSGEEAWIAGASYIPLVSAAILVLRKNNSEFVSIHARQALVIHLISIMIMVLLLPILKFFFAIIVYFILVYGAFQAIRGRKWYMPLVTEIAHTFDL